MSSDEPGLPNLALFAPAGVNQPMPHAMAVAHNALSSCPTSPLVWHTELPTFYQQQAAATGQTAFIMCNVCNERVIFPAYHCPTCKFDCHPGCVVTATDPALLKARNIYDEGPLTNGDIKGSDVLDTAQQYPGDERVQISCMRAFMFILQVCLQNEGEAVFQQIQSTFVTHGALTQVMMAMSSHPHSDVLQATGCMFVCALVHTRTATEDPIRNALGSTGVFDLLARAAARFPDHDKVQETLWHTIAVLVKNSAVNKERVGMAGFCELLVASFRIYAQPGMVTGGPVMEELCWVAASLLGYAHTGTNSAKDSNRTRLLTLGVMPFLRWAAIYPDQAPNCKEVRKWAAKSLEHLNEQVPATPGGSCVIV